MSCAFGFDVGSKLIGVAIGSRLLGNARALGVVAVRDNQPDWPALDTLHAQWQPDALVVGLPLMLDGGEQAASRRARRFAEQLAARYGTAATLVDERHSSQEAAHRFAGARAAGQKRRRDAALIDAEAAAVILDRWLAQPSPSPDSLAAAP